MCVRRNLDKVCKINRPRLKAKGGGGGGGGGGKRREEERKEEERWREEGRRDDEERNFKRLKEKKCEAASCVVFKIKF